MDTDRIRSIVSAALVVAFGALLAAQSTSTVSSRVRDAMKAQEIGWELEKSGVEYTEFFHRWVNRAEHIAITYEERASEAEAAAWLDGRPSAVSAPGGEPVADVGDRALIWSRMSETGSATIYFRKGKATVRLTAPSDAIATRIARLVAGQIHE